MLAISIKQPFAERIASGAKRAEFRSWPTNHRGDLLVVASRSPSAQHAGDLPTGVAICVVRLVSCDETRSGFAWKLADPRRVEPVAIRGRAAFFHVSDELIRFAATTQARPALIEAPIAPHRVAPRPKGGPYSIHFGRKTLEKGIATPARARERARAHAVELGSYVRIHRDGFEISGEGPR